MAEGGNPPQRSTLNAIAAVKAGQEQMQKDVHQVLARINAMLVVLLYMLGAAIVTMLAAKSKVKA